MSEYRIPFNRPHLTGREYTYVAEAIGSGKISGDGIFTNRCHEIIEKDLQVPKALLTTSCTHALEMSAILLNIKPGDEVIVPSFTFVSTINAFVLRGAKPVFADIRTDTLNIDEKQLEKLITPQTKAIVPVHYAGVGCNMQSIMEIAEKHGIAVVEDNAHGLLGKQNGKPLGSFGCMAAQSFHETKNISCGEGGALLINNPKLVERAEILREKGTDRSKFFRGQVDKYSWVDIGSSYLPSEILAAFLLAHLEERTQIQQTRRRIWDTYDTELAEWAAENNITRPTVPENCEQAYHMYYMLMPNLESRQAFIKHLKAFGILAVFHYQPLHLSTMGTKFGGRPGQCPVTERYSDTLVRLPFYNDLSPEDQKFVIEKIKDFSVEK